MMTIFHALGHKTSPKKSQNANIIKTKHKILVFFRFLSFVAVVSPTLI